MPKSPIHSSLQHSCWGIDLFLFCKRFAQGVNTPALTQEVWSRVRTGRIIFSKSQAGDLTLFNSPVYQTDLHLAVHLICSVMLTDSSWTSGLPAGFLSGLAVSACSKKNRTILHDAECITQSATPTRNEGTEHLDETPVPHASSLYFKPNCSSVCDSSFPNKKARSTQMTKAFGIWTSPTI